MKKDEIIDQLLNVMAAKETVGVWDGKFIARTIEEAQDYIMVAHGPLDENNAVFQALRVLAFTKGPVTLANVDWAERVGVNKLAGE